MSVGPEFATSGNRQFLARRARRLSLWLPADLSAANPPFL